MAERTTLTGIGPSGIEDRFDAEAPTAEAPIQLNEIGAEDLMSQQHTPDRRVLLHSRELLKEALKDLGARGVVSDSRIGGAKKELPYAGPEDFAKALQKLATNEEKKKAIPFITETDFAEFIDAHEDLRDLAVDCEILHLNIADIRLQLAELSPIAIYDLLLKRVNMMVYRFNQALNPDGLKVVYLGTAKKPLLADAANKYFDNYMADLVVHDQSLEALQQAIQQRLDDLKELAEKISNTLSVLKATL